jgi:Tfp pilus assembly protein PilF
VDANLELAKIALLKGLPDHARHFLRRVANVDPANVDALTTLAYLHYYRGESQHARELVDEALKIDAGHLPAILLLGGIDLASCSGGQKLAQALGHVSSQELVALSLVHGRRKNFSRRIWLPLERPSVYRC